jgi:hypothetical protein
MHNGVRNATELLTQEIGQAGRVSLPGRVRLAADAPAGTTALTITSSAADADTLATSGMFVGEFLLIGTNDSQETVRISAFGADTITLAEGLVNDHLAPAPIQAVGGFAEGIIPPLAIGYPNGSTPSVLKIFGDIHDNGRMMYIEYVCDTGNQRLYRNSMPFDAVGKPWPTVEQILIDNIENNPPDPNGNVTPCFTYQVQSVLNRPYVVGVAITLTVHTQNIDRNTADFQRETKALLNVSPRNVFNVWQLASLNMMNRIQPIPPQVQPLLGSYTVTQIETPLVEQIP